MTRERTKKKKLSVCRDISVRWHHFNITTCPWDLIKTKIWPISKTNKMSTRIMFNRKGHNLLETSSNSLCLIASLSWSHLLHNSNRTQIKNTKTLMCGNLQRPKSRKRRHGEDKVAKTLLWVDRRDKTTLTNHLEEILWLDTAKSISLVVQVAEVLQEGVERETTKSRGCLQQKSRRRKPKLMQTMYILTESGPILI